MAMGNSSKLSKPCPKDNIIKPFGFIPIVEVLGNGSLNING